MNKIDMLMTKYPILYYSLVALALFGVIYLMNELIFVRMLKLPKMMLYGHVAGAIGGTVGIMLVDRHKRLKRKKAIDE